MRLISCRIENFGKLSNVTYDFTRGANVICSGNGAGKSTLAAFIRVMFYGFENESKRKSTDKERVKYEPWQKGIYGGEIVFEAAGKEYSMRRVFGRKQADDEFVLTRISDNMKCNDFSSNIGEELFKIDSASFVRTVFIAQNDCVTGATDSVNAKIGNLSEFTDDLGNFEAAAERLQKQINAMSPTRITGSIAKRKSKITELRQYVDNAQGLETTVAEQTQIRDELNVKKEALKVEREKLAKLQAELARKKDIAAKKEKYNILCRQRDEKNAELARAESFFNGVYPDDVEIRRMQDILDENRTISGSLAQYAADGGEYERLRYAFSEGAPDDRELEGYAQDIVKLDDMRKVALTVKAFGTAKEKAAAGIIAVVGIAGALCTLKISAFIAVAVLLAAIVLTVVVANVMLSGRKKQAVNEADDFESDLAGRLGRYCNDGEAKNYSLAVERLKNNVNRYEKLKAEHEAHASMSERYNSNEQSVSDFVKKYMKDASNIEIAAHEKDDFAANSTKADILSESVRQIDRMVAARMRAKEEYEKAAKRVREHEQSTNISAIEEQTAVNISDIDGEKRSTGERAAVEIQAAASVQDIDSKLTLEELASRLAQISDETENINKKIAECSRNIEVMQEKLDERERNMDELEELMAVQTDEKKKCDLLKITKEFLEESKQLFTARYMEPVMNGFKKYYELLTGAAGDDYRIDADTNLTVIEQNMPRPVEALSAGKQDLTGICFRMALVEAMYEGEKPFLIFDDPFVNLDDNTLSGAKTFLGKIAEEYQFIYFTCGESRAFSSSEI